MDFLVWIPGCCAAGLLLALLQLFEISLSMPASLLLIAVTLAAARLALLKFDRQKTNTTAAVPFWALKKGDNCDDS